MVSGISPTGVRSVTRSSRSRQLTWYKTIKIIVKLPSQLASAESVTSLIILTGLLTGGGETGGDETECERGIV